MANSDSWPDLLSSSGMLMLKECRHGRMLFLRGDKYVGKALAHYDEYSENEVRLFAQLVTLGQVVVEVGANMGAHTVPLARLVGPTGAVFAFEAQRVIFQLLTANVAFNEAFRVRTVHAALGAEAGTLRVPPIDYRLPGNFGAVSLPGVEHGEAVEMRTLDSFHLPGLHFLKIDVEGMEEAVLAGARGHISRFRPLIYVENDRRAKSPALIAAIAALDYDMWWHTPPLFNPANHAGQAENLWPGVLSINMLCVPRERRTVFNGVRKVSGPEDWPLQT